MMVSIYTLSDPLTKEIFWVGRTKSPDRRLSVHMSSNPEVMRRMVDLEPLWLKPVLRVLEEVPYHDAREREQFHAARLAAAGHPLAMKRPKVVVAPPRKDLPESSRAFVAMHIKRCETRAAALTATREELKAYRYAQDAATALMEAAP